MTKRHDIHITDRDRVLRAWQNSTELVRDYQAYARETDTGELGRLLSEYAATEALHASKLLEILHGFEQR